MFRRMLAASLFADLRSFMQSVGAAWLMVSMQAAISEPQLRLLSVTENYLTERVGRQGRISSTGRD